MQGGVHEFQGTIDEFLQTSRDWINDEKDISEDSEYRLADEYELYIWLETRGHFVKEAYDYSIRFEDPMRSGLWHCFIEERLHWQKVREQIESHYNNWMAYLNLTLAHSNIGGSLFDFELDVNEDRYRIALTRPNYVAVHGWARPRYWFSITAMKTFSILQEGGYTIWKSIEPKIHYWPTRELWLRKQNFRHLRELFWNMQMLLKLHLMDSLWFHLVTWVLAPYILKPIFGKEELWLSHPLVLDKFLSREQVHRFLFEMGKPCTIKVK